MKKVLSLGQCSYDNRTISRLLQTAGAEVVVASTFEEARDLLSRIDFALVLVNRVTDSDGTQGLDFIREMRKGGERKHGIMLISNYEDAQAQARELGALPGFGKNALEDPGTITLLQKALDSSAHEKVGEDG
jgi:two-component system chemotaxis response regulator CheY